MQKPPLPRELEPATVQPAVFCRWVVRSGLLAPDQLKAALTTVPSDRRHDAQAIADHFVRTGKLSRFQARKLLEGAVLGLVLGPYQVLAPIAKGGMGTVYLARDNRNQQLVALKVLPPKRAREEERLLARFRREMELCQRVSHPHLTRTYEANEQHGVHYIAMEFIPGRTLYRTVTEGGPMAVPRAARLFAEVASGLEHAHRQGLVHRDLKPSNIMITPKDHAKVLDLGLALIEGEAVTDRLIVGGQGYVLGTMDYIAPEQAEDSSKADARSDIYSLGCTLYFALTGQKPFPGGKALGKISRHRTAEPTPIPQLNSLVPAGFADLVGKMMAKRPEQRFESANAVREALRAWAAPEPAGPVDRQDDQEYRQAVADLATADAPTELVREPIIDLPPEAIVPRLNWLSALLPRPSASAARRLDRVMAWSPFILLGVGVVLSLALVVGTLWLVLRH